LLNPVAHARLLVRRSLTLAALVAVYGGCSLGVTPFTGTTISLDLSSGTAVTAPGTHLELWGRNQHNDVFRISYTLDETELRGFSIRKGLSLTDPCAINDTGYLLTDARAYPTSVVWGGVVQTPEEQANQVLTRIKQLTSVADGGLQPSEPGTLRVMTPWDETPLPVIAADASADERQTACNAYWAASTWSYTSNPLLFGKPIHSSVMGAVDYQTSTPAQSFSDIALTSPFDLSNLEEVWFTLESVPPDQVDAQKRGPVYLQGTKVAVSEAGRGVLSFDLSGDGVSGSIAFIFPQQQSF